MFVSSQMLNYVTKSQVSQSPMSISFTFVSLKSSSYKVYTYQINLGLDATKPVFGVSEKVRLKPVFSATETSWKIEISLLASLDMILSNKRITKALIRLRGCAGWSAPLLLATHRRQVFSRRGLYQSSGFSSCSVVQTLFTLLKQLLTSEYGQKMLLSETTDRPRALR